MRIDYNILWVEDEEAWYDTTKELFAGTLDDNGFDLKPKRCNNLEEVRNLIEADGLKKYDILLVDFNLKDSTTGDEIIKLVRDNSVYTDVLFYSSAVDNVNESMRKYGLEGVYVADRKDIESKFEAIFNTTIKKVQEINSMRGLIVGETSELDVLIENLTIHISNNILGLKKEDHDKIVEGIVDKMKKNYDFFVKQCEEQDFCNYFHKIEALKKWEIFRDLLKKVKNIEKYKEGVVFFLEKNKTYQDDVIGLRNIFAHSKSEEKEGKSILKAQLGKEDYEYDDQKFIEIRKSLKDHRNNFSELFKVLEIVN